MLISTLFFESGGPAAGWTLYPPLSLQGGNSMPFVIFSLHLLGASSILGAINVIATILNMRAPGMTLMKMPIFVWTWLNYCVLTYRCNASSSRCNHHVINR